MKIFTSKYQFLLFILVTTILDLKAQDVSVHSSDDSRFIIEKDESYFKGGQMYEYEDLILLFQGKEAMGFYKQSIQKDRLSKKVIYTGLASGATATTFYYLASKQGFNKGAYYRFRNIGIVSTIVGLGLLGVYISLSRSIEKLKKRSVQSYNEQEILDNGFKKVSNSLHLKSTLHEIGLVYSF